MSITAQITMAWNGTNLIVEAANPTTGAREKLSTITMDSLPLEMQLTLRDNLRKAQAHEAAKVELNARLAQREQREHEVNERNRLAAIEADLRWQKYLEGLAPHVAAYHQNKKDQRKAKSLATSREIYTTIATTPGQGIDFANKIIEPARRPKRIEMTKNGNKVTYYPQSDDNTATKKAKKAARKNGVHIGHVDTSDFTF